MAVGDRVEKRVGGPTAMSSSSGTPTVFTVPASRQWTTKQIVFTNTNGVDAVIYFSIGAIGTVGNRIFNALPIAGYDTVVYDTAMVVDANETFQCYADRSGVNVTVVGWEKEV